MKDHLNDLYHDLLRAHTQNLSLPATVTRVFEALLRNIRSGNDELQVVSSVWKAAIRTFTKLLSCPTIVQALLSETNDICLDPNLLVEVFITAKVDPVDHAEEEQKLLLKQSVLLKILETMPVSETSRLTVLRYMLKVIKQKTVEDVDNVYSG
jgi:hypothetical protein